MSLSTTDKLAGRYRVLQKLGEGCFAETFLAEDELLPDAFRCVVKKLKTAFSEEDKQQIAKRLFDSEAHSLHRLGFHGQIPQLFAHFEENNDLYIVEEYIQGSSLYHELSKGQRWSEDYVLKLLMDLLEVLKFVHQKQVIHRDLKPSNIIRRARDGRLVLIDFGAVKQVSSQILDNDNSVVTQTVVVGTPGYMPGEQLLGNPRKSSDVYAVGMLAISALTGLNPARGELPVDEFTAELLWHNQANVSPELMTILDKMVAYDFRQRYPSAKEAFEAIQSLTRSRQLDAPTVLKEASGTIEIPADHGEGSPIQSDYVPAFKGKPDSKTGTVIINLKSLGSTILNRVGANSLLPPPPSRQVIDQTAGWGSAALDETSERTVMAGVDVPPSHRFKVKQALIQGAGIVLFGAALASPHIAPLCQTLNNCPTAAKYNPVSTSSGNAIRRSALSEDQPLPNLNRIPKQRQHPKTQVSRLSKTSKEDNNVTSNNLSSVPPSPPVNSGQQSSMGAVTNSANVSNPRMSRQKSRTIVAISPAPIPRKIRVPKSSNAIDWKPTSPKARKEWQPPRKAKAPKTVRSESRRIRRVEAVSRPVKSTRVSYAPPQRLRPRRSSVTRRRSVSVYRSTAVSTRRTKVYERRSSLRRHSYSYSKQKGSRKRK